MFEYCVKYYSHGILREFYCIANTPLDAVRELRKNEECVTEIYNVREIER